MEELIKEILKPIEEKIGLTSINKKENIVFLQKIRVRTKHV